MFTVSRSVGRRSDMSNNQRVRLKGHQYVAPLAMAQGFDLEGKQLVRTGSLHGKGTVASFEFFLPVLKLVVRHSKSP